MASLKITTIMKPDTKNLCGLDDFTEEVHKMCSSNNFFK